MIRTTRLPWIPKIHESKDSHNKRTRSKDSHNKANKDSNDKATKDSRDMADNGPWFHGGKTFKNQETTNTLLFTACPHKTSH